MNDQVGHTAEELAAAKKQGQADGVQAERARVAGIQKAFASVWGDQPPASEAPIRDGFIQLGTSVDDAERMCKERKLTVLTEAAPKTAGGGSEPAETAKVDLSNLPIEDRCKAQWEREPHIRAEFGSLGAYTAFMQAEAKGLVKILKK